jgi:very-short-patch-repair endonuclease
VEHAIASGALERVGRGRYVLSRLPERLKSAAQVQGIVSMRSAAAHHGWAQKQDPQLPDVTVPRNRRIEPRERLIVVPHWSDLPDSDVIDGVTTKRRTLVDCMRMLPLDEALPIVESALRSGDITQRALIALADSMRGRGRARARALSVLASSRPANAYESVLHALLSTIPGLNVEPQVRLRLPGGGIAKPDFVDLALGIVIEAESFEWHGESAALTRDCERYNAFVNLGLIVVRFSWTQVMFQPAYVLGVVSAAVDRARAHANVA